MKETQRRIKIIVKYKVVKSIKQNTILVLNENILNTYATLSWILLAFGNFEKRSQVFRRKLRK